MTSTLIDKSIKAQLDMIERCLACIINNVHTAQSDIKKGERNAAIGALLANTDHMQTLKILHDAILLIHRNRADFENSINTQGVQP